MAVLGMTAALPGWAQTPAVTLAGAATSPISLPDTQVGSHAVVQNVVLSINSSLTISSIYVPPSQGGIQEQEFVIGLVPDCAVDGVTVIQAGATCTVPVTFEPDYAGLRQAPLVVQTSLGQFRFGLEGLGQGPQVVFVPGLISTVAGNGSSGGGNGNPATDTALSYPEGIAVDAAGNQYIADSGDSKIWMVNATSGVIALLAGDGNCKYDGDGGPATGAELCNPSGVALDAAGNLYIADYGNNAVRELNMATGVMTTVAGNGNCRYGGDGGPATGAELCNPSGVALDAADNLYIADTGNNVIREVDLLTGVINTVAGNGTGGYSGNGGPPASAELSAPSGVALDQSGNLYIADSGNAVVREVSAVNTVASGIFTAAGNGASGWSGDGRPATGASLTHPEGVAVDPAGDLYIADSGNSVIRKVDAVTGVISTVAGNGYWAYDGDGGPAVDAELNYPSGIALDSAGNQYIADGNNSRIRMVSASGDMIFSWPGQGVTGAVWNSGNAPLDIWAIGASPNFTVSGSSCSFSSALAAGDSCSVSLAYEPTVGGALSGTLAVTDNALNLSSVTQDVELDVAAAEPTFSPPPGEYHTVLSVTLSDVTPDAVMYYTTDGSTPTTASTPYLGPIAVSSTTTIQAIAVANGYEQSLPAVGTFVIPRVPMPTFYPPPGAYDTRETVVIHDSLVSVDLPGSAIYYTTDGSTPTTASHLYTGTIVLSASATLRAIAVANGYAPSAVASGTYTLTNTESISCNASDSNGPVTLQTNISSPRLEMYGQTVTFVCVPTGLRYGISGSEGVWTNSGDSGGSLRITGGNESLFVQVEQVDARSVVVQSATYYFRAQPFPVTYTAQSGYVYYYGVAGQQPAAFTQYPAQLVGSDTLAVTTEMWNPNTRAKLNTARDPLSEALTSAQQPYEVKVVLSVSTTKYNVTLVPAPMTFAANTASGNYVVTAPSNTTLGPIALGSSKQEKASFTFDNTSGADVSWSLSGTDTSNSFALGPACTTYRSPKLSCKISVLFTPQSAGTFTDNLTATGTDINTGNIVYTTGPFPLTGYAYGSFTTDNTTYYAPQNGGPLTITVINNSGFPLTAAGSASGTLSWSNSTCQAGVSSPNNTCQLTVIYTPIARHNLSPGTLIGRLKITGTVSPAGSSIKVSTETVIVEVGSYLWY
jgi:sugar lactone lactonase YvrE